MTSPSPEAIRVLRTLAQNKCVLIKGVPASGKSRLLAEVRHLFANTAGGPVSTPQQAAAISQGTAQGFTLPSPSKSKRKTWSLVMNQNSRYREYWRALEPEVTGSGYQISEGALYRANEHAKTAQAASLVTVDELNRGPAVNVFGPSIVAIEADKRAGDDNKPTVDTTTFELPNDSGIYEDYWLSPHFYLVCAQNNADTSVEAIDTAFLRRFVPIELLPDESVLLSHFGISDITKDLPDAPAAPDDIYRAVVRAWRKVNQRLSIGASPDFQLGHGALMNPNEPVPTTTTAEALDYVSRGWARVDQHVGEVFYGKPDHIADALWVQEGGQDHPYKLVSSVFADIDQVQLQRDDSDLYKLLRVIAVAG